MVGSNIVPLLTSAVTWGKPFSQESSWKGTDNYLFNIHPPLPL